LIRARRTPGICRSARQRLPLLPHTARVRSGRIWPPAAGTLLASSMDAWAATSSPVTPRPADGGNRLRRYTASRWVTGRPGDNAHGAAVMRAIWHVLPDFVLSAERALWGSRVVGAWPDGHPLRRGVGGRARARPRRGPCRGRRGKITGSLSFPSGSLTAVSSRLPLDPLGRQHRRASPGATPPARWLLAADHRPARGAPAITPPGRRLETTALVQGCARSRPPALPGAASPAGAPRHRPREAAVARARDRAGASGP